MRKQHHIHLYLESHSDDLMFKMHKDEDGIICIQTNVETTSVAARIEDMNWESIAQNLLDLALTFDTKYYIAQRLKKEVGLDDEQLEYLGLYFEGEEE